MSSKHPVTDTVTIVSGRKSPEQTSDYSGSGDPTLVQWRRLPYESHAYPQCSSATESGSGIVSGVTNPRCFDAIELPLPSPTKPVEDLDFDTKPSDQYQSLTELSRRVPDVQYTSMGTTYKVNGERRQATCTKCSLCLWFFVLLALVVACSGVALAVFNRLDSSSGSDGDSDTTISGLQSQLTDSYAQIRELRSMVEELQQNLTRSVDTKNVEIEKLSVQLSQVNRSVEGILAAPTEAPTTTAAPVVESTVNLTHNCEYDMIDKCRISDTLLTEVAGDNSDPYPNYSSCSTDSVDIDMSDTFVQDVYCAITNLRDERNPVSATLRRDEATGTFTCFCFVTGVETRQSVVDCSMFVRRCPSIVTVN